MGTVILIVSFVLPLIVAGLIIFFVMRRQSAILDQGQKRMVERSARITMAPAAQATVVTSRVISTHEGTGEVIVELRLDVERTGHPKTSAKTHWQINAADIPQVQPGQSLAVKVDVEEPGTIYPNVSWARYWPHGR
jgi:hypothetical protein